MITTVHQLFFIVKTKGFDMESSTPDEPVVYFGGRQQMNDVSRIRNG